MVKSDEEDVLKNYPAERLAINQKFKEKLVENSKLTLESL